MAIKKGIIFSCLSLAIQIYYHSFIGPGGPGAAVADNGLFYYKVTWIFRETNMGQQDQVQDGQNKRLAR